MEELSRTCHYVESFSWKRLQIVHIRKCEHTETAGLSYMKEFPQKSCEYKPKLNSPRGHILRVAQSGGLSGGPNGRPSLSWRRHRHQRWRRQSTGTLCCLVVSVHNHGVKNGLRREHDTRQLTHLKGRENNVSIAQPLHHIKEETERCLT